jgi:hypothetical protein
LWITCSYSESGYVQQNKIASKKQINFRNQSLIFFKQGGVTAIVVKTAFRFNWVKGLARAMKRRILFEDV